MKPRKNHHQTRVWRMTRASRVDEFRELGLPPANALWLALWLEIGPKTIILPGVVPIGRLAASEALGWEPADFDRVFSELVARDVAVADWRGPLIFLPWKIREAESAPQSPTAAVSMRKAFRELPSCDLKVHIGREIREMIADFQPSFLSQWDSGEVQRKPSGEATRETSLEASGVQETETGTGREGNCSRNSFAGKRLIVEAVSFDAFCRGFELPPSELISKLEAIDREVCDRNESDPLSFAIRRLQENRRG